MPPRRAISRTAHGVAVAIISGRSGAKHQPLVARCCDEMMHLLTFTHHNRRKGERALSRLGPDKTYYRTLPECGFPHISGLHLSEVTQESSNCL